MSESMGFTLEPDRWYKADDLARLMGLKMKDPARSLVRSGIAFRKIGRLKFFQGSAVLEHFGVKQGNVLQFRKKAG